MGKLTEKEEKMIFRLNALRKGMTLQLVVPAIGCLVVVSTPVYRLLTHSVWDKYMFEEFELIFAVIIFCAAFILSFVSQFNLLKLINKLINPD